MDYLLHHALRTSADRYPQKEALVQGDDRWSFAEFLTNCDSLAAGLQELGIDRCDRVGVLLKPGIAQSQSIYSISLAGAAFVPIHHSLMTEQVSHIVRDCGMRLLICSPDMLSKIDPSLAENSDLQNVVLFSDGQQEHPSLKVHNAADVSAIRKNASFIPNIENDLGAILYTSGSTGKPKGVMLSHRNLVAGASIVSDYLNINQNDRILAALPFSFDAGLNQLTTAVQQGSTLVHINFLFAKQIVDALHRENITGLAGVPPLWCLLANKNSTLERRPPETLRYITNTGGVLPDNVLSTLRNSLPNTDVFLMYGLTEAFRSTYLPPSELDRRPGSMGKAIPNTEILVVNDAGQPCAPGEVGELVHSGPTVSLGYWNRPDLTAEVIRDHPLALPEVGNVDRVVYSGDLVRTDEDGYLYFVSRRDNMIKTSGFRVSPNEVEDGLSRTGLVDQVAVIGVPDEMLGQRIVAFVMVNDVDTFDEDDLLADAAAYLPNYMIPKTVHVISQLPKTSSGKIDYQALRSNVSKANS